MAFAQEILYSAKCDYCDRVHGEYKRSQFMAWHVAMLDNWSKNNGKICCPQCKEFNDMRNNQTSTN